jgi:KipI family sensor histidine kinase inhibitor
MTLGPLGDSAVVIDLGLPADSQRPARVAAVAAAIRRAALPGVVDVVPAFGVVAVYLDPARAPAGTILVAELEARARQAMGAVVAGETRTMEIPVAYGGEFGPDLAEVAGRAGLPLEAVIALHSGSDYAVQAIGFVPGFPYLGGLPAQLATPRRATPRLRVPAGTVGIGGTQTGIYPLETPGGWNLIGRTARRLFDPARADPALLRVGDAVRFRPISAEELAAEAGPADPAVAGIDVRRAGLFTTVQDAGRPGWRAAGVPLSGAADPFALRLANLLVGNAEDAAGLEFTLDGPELHFRHDTVAAFGGADFSGWPRWRPLQIPAGTVIKTGRARQRCRGYLAVAGGIQAVPVLGSRSTYVRAVLGGMGGRTLREGDVLAVPAVRRQFGGRWHIDERILPYRDGDDVVRVTAGAQAEDFDPAWMTAGHRVSSHSDRMGLRLSGATMVRRRGGELGSAPVAPGTIQVPPDGQPIVLLADAQTIGGYPQAAHVVAADLPQVAQLRPGERVRFREVEVAEAREWIAARERALALLREGLAQKLA